MKNIVDRFLKYISFDSDPNSNSSPSSSKQLLLANYLVEEMKEIGISNAFVDQYGIVYGLLSGNSKEGKILGFFVRIDTSPDASGKDIKPQLIKNYDGKRILLNKEKNLYLDSEEFDNLKQLVSYDLITTDDITLLGANDKAGIAIIMQTCEYFLNHPEIEHNDIYIVFTPDKEVGRGVENFDLKKFKAEWAYTIDGSKIEEVAYENFDAFKVKVTINGKSIHPGDAKGKMINSILVAQEFVAMLPTHIKPEYTEKYEGFNHLHEIHGNCEKTEMEFIVRNHDLAAAKKQFQDFIDIMTYLNNKYGYKIIEADIKQQYLNMRELIEKDMDIVHIANEAIKQVGTGGFNYHGPFEYVSITFMNKMVDVLKNIIINNACRNN